MGNLTLAQALRPARQPDESFGDYRARRAGVNLAVRNHLRGRFYHISSRIVTLPVAGEDSDVDEAFRRGQYRDGAELLDAKQKPYRVARTKGVRVPGGYVEPNGFYKLQKEIRKANDAAAWAFA